jgi:hypothetical protein
MIFVHDRQFQRALMVSYVNECLSRMREAQKLFGSFPDARPNAETEILAGRRIKE